MKTPRNLEEAFRLGFKIQSVTQTAKNARIHLKRRFLTNTSKDNVFFDVGNKRVANLRNNGLIE